MFYKCSCLGSECLLSRREAPFLGILPIRSMRWYVLSRARHASRNTNLKRPSRDCKFRLPHLSSILLTPIFNLPAVVLTIPRSSQYIRRRVLGDWCVFCAIVNLHWMCGSSRCIFCLDSSGHSAASRRATFQSHSSTVASTPRQM